MAAERQKAQPVDQQQAKQQGALVAVALSHPTTKADPGRGTAKGGGGTRFNLYTEGLGRWLRNLGRAVGRALGPHFRTKESSSNTGWNARLSLDLDRRPLAQQVPRYDQLDGCGAVVDFDIP